MRSGCARYRRARPQICPERAGLLAAVWSDPGRRSRAVRLSARAPSCCRRLYGPAPGRRRGPARSPVLTGSTVSGAVKSRSPTLRMTRWMTRRYSSIRPDWTSERANRTPPWASRYPSGRSCLSRATAAARRHGRSLSDPKRDDDPNAARTGSPCRPTRWSRVGAMPYSSAIPACRPCRLHAQAVKGPGANQTAPRLRQSARLSRRRRQRLGGRQSEQRTKAGLSPPGQRGGWNAAGGAVTAHACFDLGDDGSSHVAWRVVIVGAAWCREIRCEGWRWRCPGSSSRTITGGRRFGWPDGSSRRCGIRST